MILKCSENGPRLAKYSLFVGKCFKLFVTRELRIARVLLEVGIGLAKLNFFGFYMAIIFWPNHFFNIPMMDILEKKF